MNAQRLAPWAAHLDLFPREGKVWVHTKNLKPLDGGARYQVTQEQTRARNDASVKSRMSVPSITICPSVGS